MNKLEKYLKHRGMSQKRFCEKIGLTANNLCLLLKGKTTPTLQTAYKIEMMTGGLVTVYDWIPEDVKKMQKEIEEN